MIIVDTREKPQAIQLILKEFDRRGIEYTRHKLDFGDYMDTDNPNICIDRKQNLLEVTSNVVQEHERFVREIERSRKAGCKLIILVEHSRNIRTLSDVIKWKNPRLYRHPLAVSGERLFRILYVMEKKYGIKFLFCDKRETGKRIIEILEGEQIDELNQ